MSINKLYISHGKYKFDHQQSSLLDYKNYQRINDSTDDADYHTSFSDLAGMDISILFKNVKEIIVVDIDFTDLTYNTGRLLNEIYKNNLKVEFLGCKELDVYAINKVNQKRPHNKPVMWMAGCSITAGYGVAEHERYGKILSENLNTPEILLAKLGSSILYAADQLLRSDIRADDIVIWGLTNIPRVEVCDNTDFCPVPVTSYDFLEKSLQYWDLDYFSSPTQNLIHIRMILQVVNFCNKVGARLYLANMIDTTWIPVVFKDYSNFINFSKEVNLIGFTKFMDLGTDGAHPGPEQHKEYAKKIFNLIEGQ
jgi:hypothetical protein